MRSRLRAVLVALLACVPMTGCDLFAGPRSEDLLPGPRSETCVDWVQFGTPQELFDDATLVVIGRPAGNDGTTSVYGYTAQIHLVEVEAVLKGQPGPGPLRIASTPETCTGGNSYPQGDPLDARQRMLVYASYQHGGWSTLTPGQGTEPFPEGAALPFRPS